MGGQSAPIDEQDYDGVRVAMVTGPDDGQSGIGDYAADLVSEMRETHIESILLPMGRNKPVVFARGAIKAGTTEADVVHVQHEYGLFGTVALMSWVFFPLLYGLAAIQRTPVVVTVHEGLNDRLVVKPFKRVKQFYLYVLNRLVVANAGHVVFLSKHTAAEFTESVPLGSYSVLPHGASTDRSLDMSRAEAKRRLGYDPEQTVVAQPGYVEPRKGSDRMVALAARMEEHEFLLAGGPASEAHEDYFEEIVDRAPPNLTVTGFLNKERFHASFVASDLVVLSHQESKQGGIINTVNQSGILNRCATYGRPVVTSDLAYFRTLEREWECLRLCDFKDINEAEAVVRELLADEAERKRLSERIREYAKANSFAETAERHNQIYRTVLSGQMVPKDG